jgi:hypothetical protein
MIATYLSITFILLVASYLLLFFKTKCSNPIFFIFSVFSIFYLVLSELYRAAGDNFPMHVYQDSAELSTYCALAILCSVLLFGKNSEKLEKIEALSDLNITILRLGYFSLFCIGYVFLILNYNRFGGVEEFFNLGPRADRNHMMRATPGNYPYQTILFCAFVIALVSEFFINQKARKKSFYGFAFLVILIVPSLLLLVVDGERSHILKYVIAYLSLIFARKLTYKDISIRQLISIGSIFILMIVIGNTRTITNKILQGDTESAMLSFNLMMNNFPRAILPNEFAALASTTHYILAKSPPLLYGESYKNALTHAIPRSLMKIEKPVPISDRLSKSWALELFNYDEYCVTQSCEIEKERVLQKRKTFSTSISPIAEAIWNFGKLGPCLIYFLMAYFFIKLDGLLRCGSIAKVGFAVGSSFLALAFHRSAFAGIFSFEIYMILFIWFPFILAATTSKYLHKVSA